MFIRVCSWLKKPEPHQLSYFSFEIMSQYGWNNCPTDVRRQIEHLVEHFKIQIAENLIGIYLHGSLALGCFNPLRSDIDLLALTKNGMTVETKHEIADFLLKNSRQPAPLEISFLQQTDLLPWRYPTSFDFHYSEDWREKFEFELANGNWKQWNDVSNCDEDLATHITLTNHRGICLYGAAISDVFPNVPKLDFISSILADVESAKCGIESILHNPVYVVLNICRTLAFLQTGLILSKDEGGVWALENLPVQFNDIISNLLNEYRSGNDSNIVEKELMDFAVFVQNELTRLK